MIREETQLILGRGEVYFEPFLAGTRAGEGERYIGNTTDFQLSRVVTRAERFTSYKGRKIQRPSLELMESHSVQFTTDNISAENVGLWFGGEPATRGVSAQGRITEDFTVRRGRFIQLGKTARPGGVPSVEYVIVKKGATTIPALNNWEMDYATGRMQILPNSPAIANGTTLSITFESRSAKTERVESKATDVYGAMRFIATNEVGTRRHYFFPYVRLSARGSVNLKSDQWQQMLFEGTALNLTPATAQVYSDGNVVTGGTADEEAIIDFGGITLESFPYWEDQLHQIINISMRDHY